MKASKCFAILLFVILQFLLLSGTFYLFYLILPVKIQDTFQRSFIRQKILFIKYDRRFMHFLSHKFHNTSSPIITDDVDFQSSNKPNSDQDDDIDYEEVSGDDSFDYNAILTEIPILRRSTQVHGFLLIIVQIIRTFYGLFHSTFYAIKSIIKILFTSITSTIKYALYRSKGVNTILTTFVIKILSFITKFFRFMTYWLRFLMKIGRIIIYKFFLHDDEPVYL